MTIKKILIIANLDKIDVETMLPQLQEDLETAGFKVFTFTYRGICEEPQVPVVDLAVVLGGDGTVLFSAKILLGRNVPILGVNMGNVGFLTEVIGDEWKQALEKYLVGQLGISRRIMVRADVHRQGQVIRSFTALNDGVVSASGSSKIVYYEVSVSGAVLGEYRADGMIVATPTGSTAYSLAAGGPIVHPEAETLILTPICPHSLSNRPVVVPGAEEVSIRLSFHQRTDISLTVDGRDVFPLLPGDEVVFRVLDHKTLLIRSDKRNFYEVVRAKLN